MIDTREFIDIKDFKGNENTYRVTFNCVREDYDDVCNAIEAFGVIVKEEIEQYVE